MEYERSLITKFRKDIYRPFITAITQYHLINENDTILVCLSGGKDSTVMALLLQQIQKYGDIKFNLKYALMNPGYSKKELTDITTNLNKLGISFDIYPTKIFKIDKHVHPKNPCYLCSKMRRGALYAIGQELGCNKIALGHNFNDVTETIMLNMLFNGTYSGMLPIIDSDNYQGMQLIRPLYLVKEEAIIKWSKYNKITFVKPSCPLAVKQDGKREQMKELIKELDDKYEYASDNIFHSMENVNIHNILGTKNR